MAINKGQPGVQLDPTGLPVGQFPTVEEGVGPVGALQEARVAGLLEGDRTEHVSFRAPRALLEAARRRSGVASTTELGILALAMLAQPDPVAAFMHRTRGRLGADHTLDT